MTPLVKSKTMVSDIVKSILSSLCRPLGTQCLLLSNNTDRLLTKFLNDFLRNLVDGALCMSGSLGKFITTSRSNRLKRQKEELRRRVT